jgi:hypothetical protein
MPTAALLGQSTLTRQSPKKRGKPKFPLKTGCDGHHATIDEGVDRGVDYKPGGKVPPIDVNSLAKKLLSPGLLGTPCAEVQAHQHPCLRLGLLEPVCHQQTQAIWALFNRLKAGGDADLPHADSVIFDGSDRFCEFYGHAS